MDSNNSQHPKSKIPIRKIDGSKGIANLTSPIRGDETHANMSADSSSFGGVSHVQTMKPNSGTTIQDKSVRKATTSKCGKGLKNSSIPIRKKKINQMGTKHRTGLIGIQERATLLEYSKTAKTEKTVYNPIDNISPPPELNFSDPKSSCDVLKKILITKEMDQIETELMSDEVTEVKFIKMDPIENIISMDSIQKDWEKEEPKLEETDEQENILTAKTSMRVIYKSSIKRESSTLISIFTNAIDERFKYEAPVKQVNIFKATSPMNENDITSKISDESPSLQGAATVTSFLPNTINFMSPPLTDPSCDLDKSIDHQMPNENLIRSLDSEKESREMEKLKPEEVDRQKNMLTAKFSKSEVKTSSISSKESSSFTRTDTDVTDNSPSFINAGLQNSMTPFTKPNNAPFCIMPRIEINRTAPLNKISKNDSESSVHVKRFFKYSEVRRCQIVHSPATDVKNLRRKQSQLIEATAATEEFLANSKQPRRTHPNPISANTLDICRKPLECPEMECKQLICFSEFLQHLIVDHSAIRMERVSAGELKTIFLNINVVSLNATKCHAVFLVRDRLLDVTKGKYGDLLPIMIMTKYVYINEVIGSSSDDVIVDSKMDTLLFLWPVTILDKKIPLKVSITIWPINDRCIESNFCYVGDVLSLRTPATVPNLISCANVIILNAEQIKTLSNGGKQLIPMQFIVE